MEKAVVHSDLVGIP